MLRKIIKPTSENYNLQIPKEYINKKIEILILPFNTKKDKKSLFGALHKYANSNLIEKEKDIAWEKIAKDKSAIS